MAVEVFVAQNKIGTGISFRTLHIYLPNAGSLVVQSLLLLLLLLLLLCDHCCGNHTWGNIPRTRRMNIMRNMKMRIKMMMTRMMLRNTTGRINKKTKR